MAIRTYSFLYEKIVIVLFILLFSISSFLYIDCSRTTSSIYHMLEMQEMYQQQMELLKQSLENKDAQEGQESDIPEEQTLPTAATDEFVLVNRDSSYLKKNLKTFVADQRLLKKGQSLSEIYSADEYAFIATEDTLRKKQATMQRSSGKKKKGKSKSFDTYSQLQQLSKKARSAADHMIYRDFDFVWPIDLKNFWISSPFGPRKRPDGRPSFHYGIDMAAMKGVPVKAAASGKVMQAQYAPGYGNNIILSHAQNYRTRYAHLHSIKVKPGQWVQAGQTIGTVGDTGFVRKSGKYATHLHFEIHENGKPVNPLRYLFH